MDLASSMNNEEIRKVKKVIHIAQAIDGGEKLIDKDRTYQLEGSLTLLRVDNIPPGLLRQLGEGERVPYCFLFSDVLAFCGVNTTSGALDGQFPFRLVTILRMREMKELLTHDDSQFTIRFKNSQSWMFAAPSTSARKEWLDALLEARKALRAKDKSKSSAPSSPKESSSNFGTTSSPNASPRLLVLLR